MTPADEAVFIALWSPSANGALISDVVMDA
jgi:hypothetical protein